MSTAVTTTEPRTFKELIQTDQYLNGLAKALPPGVTAERVQKIIIAAMNKKPELLQCTPLSMYQACIECATLNLWPGLQQHVYLIPRWTKVKSESGVREELHAEAMIGWQGYAELAYRSDAIVPGSFIGQAIHQNDLCEYEYGSNQKMIHRPRLGDRGNIIGAWVGCVPKGGSLVFHVMDVVEIEAIRRRSKTPDAGPWVTDYAEMCCKTVFRRLRKYLPSSVTDKFAEALEREMEREFDLRQTAVANARPGRFSEDAAPEKSAGKAALDGATAEVERREAQQGPTAELCAAVAQTKDRAAVAHILRSFGAETIGLVPPEQLGPLMIALQAAKPSMETCP